MSKARKKKWPPKRVLTLPDLEQSKSAVLNSLTQKKRAAHLRPCDHRFRDAVLFGTEANTPRFEAREVMPSWRS